MKNQYNVVDSKRNPEFSIVNFLSIGIFWWTLVVHGKYHQWDEDIQEMSIWFCLFGIKCVDGRKLPDNVVLPL